MNFEEEVKEDGVVIVDFHAKWCGPCKVLEPVLDELVRSNSLKLIKIDIDSHGEIASEYDIRGVPTLLFFKDGELKARKVGMQSLSELQKEVNNLNG